MILFSEDHNLKFQISKNSKIENFEFVQIVRGLARDTPNKWSPSGGSRAVVAKKARPTRSPSTSGVTGAQLRAEVGRYIRLDFFRNHIQKFLRCH